MPKASRKTPARSPKVFRKTKQAARLPPPEDYLEQHLVQYLGKTHLTPEHQEILKEVVLEYREKLQSNYFRQHSRVDAWRKVLEKINKRVKATQKDFAPDSEVEEPPKKRKRKTKRTAKTPIPKLPQRTRVINIVSEWLRGYGIKPKSKYILKMDTILSDTQT